MKDSRHARKDHRIRRNFIKTLGIGTLLLTITSTDLKVYNYYSNGVLEVINETQTVCITRMIPTANKLKKIYTTVDDEILEKAHNLDKEWRKYNKNQKKEIYK